MSDHPLDRPFWSALTGAQAAIATGQGLARRYQSDVSAIGAVADASPAALRDLAPLIPEDGVLTVPQAFDIGCPEIATQDTVMAWQLLAAEGGPNPHNLPNMTVLTEADWPAMLALANLTNPGPFMLRTPLMGRFWGVKVNGALIAMGGQRLRTSEFVEISAICTHPDHRGTGLGTALCLFVRDQIRAGGQTPFLHAYQSNTGAIGLYERLGFVKRTAIHVSHFTKKQGAP